MQLTMHKIKGFDLPKAKSILMSENKFIMNLFSILPIPASAQRKEDEDQDEEESSVNYETKKLFQSGNTSRANSLQELQKRLAMVKGKGRLTYREKLVKKGIKNRIKKKTKRDERNAQKKLTRAQKTEEKETSTVEPDVKNAQPKKPVFNADNKMVFSKIDFTDIGTDKKKKKQTNDPKKLLKNLQEQNEKLGQLEASGEVEKAVEIKEKSLWRNALAKAGGAKVKDDVTLLKRSVKKKEQIKKSSKKKWENRLEGVEKAKEERQTKRMDNINKRKKEKKVKKIKKAVKKGKIIPGY